MKVPQSYLLFPGKLQHLVTLYLESFCLKDFADLFSVSVSLFLCLSVFLLLPSSFPLPTPAPVALPLLPFLADCTSHSLARKTLHLHHQRAWAAKSRHRNPVGMMGGGGGAVRGEGRGSQVRERLQLFNPTETLDALGSTPRPASPHTALPRCAGETRGHVDTCVVCVCVRACVCVQTLGGGGH